MHLQDHLTPNTNVVEIYICPSPPTSEKIKCGWETVPPLPFKQLSARNDFEIVEFNHRNLIYQYDLGTDIQKTIQSNWEKDAIVNNNYILSLHEEILPTHRFPCTNEITNKKQFHRVSYKWNNRIFLNVEKEENEYTCYIRYNHIHNADLDKMNEEMNRLLHFLQRNPVVERRV